jgi:hypothetical protein
VNDVASANGTELGVGPPRSRAARLSALLAGVGVTVRRRGSAEQRRFALLGALATMIVGTAYLFWGALLWPG